MKILKYIITENKTPVIFSKSITHNEVLSTGISAGFLILKLDLNCKKFLVTCYGESSSLKIKKADDDEFIIEKFLNNEFCTLEV
ncbi:hypothetical protein [Flavobacterium franklandianum]|uniref:Uncharacterized protein n=1 Tax=Flavobacterium franklandianum TaxID=2594430 RepID=A0A553C610_9FLAO|nr:hypothetical protein [Flavobacterium franklandianum]TRX15969.1 hypothetical protein FNW17_15535 [Flavobacterium franklandianum]